MYCRVSTSNRSKSEGFFSSSSFSLSSPDAVALGRLGEHVPVDVAPSEPLGQLDPDLRGRPTPSRARSSRWPFETPPARRGAGLNLLPRARKSSVGAPQWGQRSGGRPRAEHSRSVGSDRLVPHAASGENRAQSSRSGGRGEAGAAAEASGMPGRHGLLPKAGPVRHTVANGPAAARLPRAGARASWGSAPSGAGWASVGPAEGLPRGPRLVRCRSSSCWPSAARSSP